MDALLTGKVTMESEATINRFKDLGLANDLTHNNVAFERNCNKNSSLDFILDNLK